MWLPNAATHQLEAFEGTHIPAYAILSHRWEDGEVLFKDIQKERHHGMRGFYKIAACCRQTLHDGLQYVGVDTCCIDKRSSAELSEAINSMYRWYQEAAVCYAYLSDVETALIKVGQGMTDELSASIWFTRGWTLQELLAPQELFFYDASWKLIGSRSELRFYVSTRTGIPSHALVRFQRDHYSIAERMSWAAKRKITRVEDRAYSLLGIFDVNMPYGEGKKAFRRLQEHIMATSNELSSLHGPKVLIRTSP